MALSFADATGNLFNRLGRLGKVLSQARSCQTSQLTNLTSTSAGVVAQYNGEPDVQALVGASYVGVLNAVGSVGATMQSVARQTVNRMVFRDNPRIAQTLTAVNVTDSIREVIRQMRAAGATVRAHSVAATPSAFSGAGDGAVNASVVRPEDGLTLENAYAETLLVECTRDSYTGGATAGNETLAVTGTGRQGDVFAFDWPLGSDASQTVSAIDAGSDASAGNLLTNGGFEDFTSNAPDSWTVSVGAAGTHFFQESTLTFGGSAALRLTGDGATLAALYQEFDSDDGTSEALEAETQYSLCVWARRDGLAAAAGELAVELVDGDGAVINDNAGAANRFTIDLTALGTSYAAHKGVFRTPTDLPDACRLQFRMTSGNALTSGRSVYLDHAGLGEMQQLYTAGPYVAVHSGATPFQAGDYATVAVTNGRGAGGSLDTFQTLWARLFPEMLTTGLLLPSSAVPSISDGLITS